VRDITDKYIPELSLSMGSFGDSPVARLRNTLSPATPTQNSGAVGGVGSLLINGHASLSVKNVDEKSKRYV